MDVMKWSRDALPGQRVVYYRGHTIGECSEQHQALRASQLGFVFLAQRRRNGGLFDYEATRISKGTAQRLGLLPPPEGTIGRLRL